MGFVATSLVWSNVGLFLGARQPLLLVVTLVVSAALVVRMRAEWKASVVRWIPSLAIGFVLVGGLALLPQARVTEGLDLNHPTTNHDAYFYASSQKWVEQHRYSSRPSLNDDARPGSDAPGVSSAVVLRDANVRAGESLVAAFLDPMLVGRDTVDWYRTRATWLIVAFSIFLSAGVLMGLSRGSATIAAVVGAGAWQAMYQMYNQNAPALVGLALVSMMIALGHGIRAQVASRRDLLQLAAFWMAGLIAVYGELLPVAVVGFVLFLMSRREFSWSNLGSLALCGIGALALAPYSAYQAIMTNLRVGGLVNFLGDPAFWGRAPAELVRLFFGVGWAVNDREVLGYAFAVLVLGGVAVLSRRVRSAAPVVFVVCMFLLVVRLGRREAFYSLDRLVQTTGPTVIWIAAVGLLLGSSFRPRRKPAGVVMAVPLVLAVVAAPIRYLASVGPLDWRATPDSLIETAERALEMASGGSQLMVHTTQYVDRLWVSLGMTGSPETEYAYLSPDYFRMARFDDGRPDGYLLTNLTPTGKGLRVMEESDGYRLYPTAGSVMGFVVGTSMESAQSNDGRLTIPRGQLFRVLLWSTGELARVEIVIRNAEPGSSLRTQSGELLGGIDENGLISCVMPTGTTTLMIDSPVRSSGNWEIELRSVNAG